MAIPKTKSPSPKDVTILIMAMLLPSLNRPPRRRLSSLLAVAKRYGYRVKIINKKLQILTEYQVFADFIKRIDEIKDIDDKRRFAAQYLIRHGLDSANPDCILAEVAYKAFDSPNRAMFGDLATIFAAVDSATSFHRCFTSQ